MGRRDMEQLLEKANKELIALNREEIIQSILNEEDCNLSKIDDTASYKLYKAEKDYWNNPGELGVAGIP